MNPDPDFDPVDSPASIPETEPMYHNPHKAADGRPRSELAFIKNFRAVAVDPGSPIWESSDHYVWRHGYDTAIDDITDEMHQEVKRLKELPYPEQLHDLRNQLDYVDTLLDRGANLNLRSLEGRSVKLAQLLDLAQSAVRFEEQWREVLESEHALSDAYLRLRVLIGDMEHAPVAADGVDSMWTYTEKRLRNLVYEHGAMSKLIQGYKSALGVDYDVEIDRAIARLQRERDDAVRENEALIEENERIMEATKRGAHRLEDGTWWEPPDDARRSGGFRVGSGFIATGGDASGAICVWMTYGEAYENYRALESWIANLPHSPSTERLVRDAMGHLKASVDHWAALNHLEVKPESSSSSSTDAQVNE